MTITAVRPRPRRPRTFSGRKLRQIRQSQQLGQAQLAVELDVAQATVSRWENGSRTPEADMLGRIAHVLHCSIDDMFE